MNRPQFEKRPCRPREHLHTAGRLYPSAWREADEFRANRGAGIPNWPEWCYVPIAATQAIVANDAGLPVQMLGLRYPERIYDAARLAALAPWRFTQGIFRFDPATYDAVCATPVKGDIPHEVLFHMPQWSVYIETPGMQLGMSPLVGFFAHLEHDVNTGAAELRFVLDVDAQEGPALVPIPLHLGAWPLAESIERATAVAAANMPSLGLGALAQEFSATATAQLRPTLEPLVSLLLYLCSQDGDIGDGSVRPTNPKPKRTAKQGWRLFQADKPHVWDVGVRMGAALRRARKTREAQDREANQTSGKANFGPHYRAMHWHLFWKGPQKGPREAVVKWMPPIPVLMDGVLPDELPAVIRPVK